MSAAKRQWLAKNHSKHPLTHLAREVGCCVDTLKRILVREGLAEFEGAKFALRRDHDAQLWQRPCMRCKCTIARPKNQYICDRCSRLEEPYA